MKFTEHLESNNVFSGGAGEFQQDLKSSTGLDISNQYVAMALGALIGILIYFMFFDTCQKLDRMGYAQAYVVYSGFKSAFKGKSGFASECDEIKDKLVKAGWVLYTMKGCGYCTKQMLVLDGSYPLMVVRDGANVNMIQNGTSVAYNQSMLPIDKIEGYPAWYNIKTNEVKYGLHLTKDFIAKHNSVIENMNDQIDTSKIQLLDNLV